MHAFIVEWIWLGAAILRNESRTIVDIGSITDCVADTTIA
jgi:hypothetical protein